MNEFQKELDYYKKLNSAVKHGEVVLLGSTFAGNIPVSELAQAFETDCRIYSRCFNDLSVSDALSVVNEAVLSLNPSKVVIQLGETDIERGYKSVNEIISDYEKLIGMIKAYDRKMKIVIVSVCSSESETTELNKALEKMADRNKCQFADIGNDYSSDSPYIKAFSKLRYFFQERISLFDIMNPA